MNSIIKYLIIIALCTGTAWSQKAVINNDMGHQSPFSSYGSLNPSTGSFGSGIQDPFCDQPKWWVECMGYDQKCMGMYSSNGGNYTLNPTDYYMYVNVVFETSTKALLNGYIDVVPDAGQNPLIVSLKDLGWEILINNTWYPVTSNNGTFLNLQVKTVKQTNQRYVIQFRFAPKKLSVKAFDKNTAGATGTYGFSVSPRFQLVDIL